MKSEISYFPFETKYGKFELGVTSKGLYLLNFPRRTRSEFIEKESMGSTVSQRREVAEGAIQSVVNYLEGKRELFKKLKIDWSGYTPFQKKVLQSLRKVGFGKTISYLDLAKSVGSPRGARAIGGVMRINRLPIILPCHRIIQTQGSLGGYSLGLSWKRRLLDLESGMHQFEAFESLNPMVK